MSSSIYFLVSGHNWNDWVECSNGWTIEKQVAFLLNVKQSPVYHNLTNARDYLISRIADRNSWSFVIVGVSLVESGSIFMSDKYEKFS